MNAGCKRAVKVVLRDPATLKGSSVDGFYHPRGCFKARFDHLDLPQQALEGSFLGDLAARGGARVWVEELGGCYELQYDGVAGVILCIEGLEAGRGWGYITSHRPGWIYVALPRLRPGRPGRR